MTEADRMVTVPSFADADADADETVLVERDTDATVVVERTPREAQGHGPDADADAENGDGDDADADATVVVARDSAPVDDTEPDTEPDTDATRVVVREQSAKPPLTHPAEQIMKTPTRRDRRRPAPAPVSEDVLRTAEPGIGPGLAGHYPARDLPVAAPAPLPELTAGPPPTRDPSTALPSVARRSRRSAVVSIAAFATACAITVAGIGAVVVAAVTGLLG
ncbi:hypothetical protein BJ978_000869 [Agromyces terreus]|uniref:Uncharacterized protein n=1 Tax=Agromyces terreus TaxID=424795 RepID=A0A9X2KAB7_9MICO|nr:hypothetical protein [Agromyces terreus]MCP2370193.1 hypothetical protein [Agromyces terreus]